MKAYVPIFFDWLEVTGELNAQEKGRLIDAIVLYARGGNWQEQIKGNERYLFPAFRKQIDRSREISEVRAEAGRSKPKQTAAKVSKPHQTQANATNANEEEKEEENKEEIYNTHHYTQQEGYARAREGWYQPDLPDEGDEAWRDSPSVRGAVAQRIIDYVRQQSGFNDAPVVTEAGMVGNELHRALTSAMEAGISPAECQKIGSACNKAWLWEGHMKALAISGGADVPDKWRDQVEEIREDLVEVTA